MITRRSGERRNARALRFLLLCIGGWIGLRILMNWNPALPVQPDAVMAPWPAPRPFISNGTASGEEAPLETVRQENPTTPRRRDAPPPFAVVSEYVPPVQVPEASRGGGWSANLPGLHFALMARLLPSPGGFARSAIASGGPVWFPVPPATRAAPGHAQSFWIRRGLEGWSLDSWFYLRDGGVVSPEGIAPATQLGGSQAGLRLGYGFGDTGRVRAYGRATIAVDRPEQREVAFGLSFAPAARLPVDLAIERRVAVGREGRTAFAAMVSGGVSDVALPGDFRLDAYGQAGVVGARRRDGFADGAVVIDRRLGTDERASLRLGALAAGAAQPGAARVDVGPRLTLRLPHVGEGGRIALDWRQRVAGDARPESGLALTLAAGF